MTTENVHDQIEASPAVGRVEEDINLLSSPSASKAEVIKILTSPKIIADLFRTRLTGVFPQGSILKECKPQVLRDRLHNRQVVLYRLVFSHPSALKTKSAMLVLKRFVDRTKGRHEYRVMKMLWEKGFDYKSNLRVPRAFSFFEDLSLLIQERAHGTLLRKNLTRQSPVAFAGQRVAARWLIKLHGVDADGEGISLHPDDGISIRSWVQRIGNREPKLLPNLEEVGSLIMTNRSFFKNLQFTLVHGDFQCDNIFVEKEKATVIDFGRFCKSDPARDLGCMIAQARTISFLENASFAPVLPGLRVFWEEYVTAASAEERESLSERTCMFVALKYLENIDYILALSPEKGKKVWHNLLDDAERFAKAKRVEEIL